MLSYNLYLAKITIESLKKQANDCKEVQMSKGFMSKHPNSRQGNDIIGYVT